MPVDGSGGTDRRDSRGVMTRGELSAVGASEGSAIVTYMSVSMTVVANYWSLRGGAGLELGDVDDASTWWVVGGCRES